MGNRNENTLVGLVSRAVSLVVALVLTGIIATQFASATNRVPDGLQPASSTVIQY